MPSPAFVRTNLQSAINASQSSFAFALTTGYSARDTALVFIALPTAPTINSVTDSAGNTYTALVATNAGTITLALYAAANVAAGTPTITVALSAASTACGIVVNEYSAAGSSADVTATNSGSTTAASTGTTAATANAVELVTCAFFSFSASGFPTCSTPTGYTARGTANPRVSSSFGQIATFDLITVSKGTQSAAATITPNGGMGSWNAVIAALLPPAAVGASLRLPNTPTLPTLPSVG
jgi:hypothetical protein